MWSTLISISSDRYKEIILMWHFPQEPFIKKKKAHLTIYIEIYI